MYVCIYGSESDDLQWQGIRSPHAVIPDTHAVLQVQSPNMPVIDSYYGKNGERVLYMLLSHPGKEYAGAELFESKNFGMRWRHLGVNLGCTDECAVFYNPFRKKWIWSFRENTPDFRRVRRYQEVANLEDAALCYRIPGRYQEGEAVPWMLPSSNISELVTRLHTSCRDQGKREHCLQRPACKNSENATQEVQGASVRNGVLHGIYRVAQVAYEGFMLTMINIFLGITMKNTGATLLELGISRNGFDISGLPNFSSPSYSPLAGIPHEPLSGFPHAHSYPMWVHSINTNSSHVFMYYCSHLMVPEDFQQFNNDAAAGNGETCSCFRGSFRRDGFASVASASNATGVILTHPIDTQELGPILQVHVNVRCINGGSLKVGIYHSRADTSNLQDLQSVTGYSIETCHPITGDHIDTVVHWTSPHKAPLEPQFRLLFRVSNCDLFSFFFTTPSAGREVPFSSSTHVPTFAATTQPRRLRASTILYLATNAQSHQTPHQGGTEPARL